VSGSNNVKEFEVGQREKEDGEEMDQGEKEQCGICRIEMEENEGHEKR